MAICRYCGAETGNSPFCQNCGAKVEAAPAPQPIPQEQPAFTPDTIPTQPQSYSIPTQPTYYTPGGAGGLMAGNIIAIILGVVCCCFTYFISLVTMVLGIIGVVYASKVKASMSPEEERHNRNLSRIMMIIGYVVLLLGLVVFIGMILTSSNGFEGLKETWNSIYESVSISMAEGGN